jgi:flagellar protein FlgJ
LAGSFASIGYHLFTAAADSPENPLQVEKPMQAPLLAPDAPGPLPRSEQARRDLLMNKAQELEAAFMAEMLAHAGLDAKEGEFSGGIGEEQFSSFLRQAQAKAITENGGIGLAQRLFDSLVRSDHATE